MKVSFSVSDLNELFAQISQQTASHVVIDRYEQIIRFPSLVGKGWMQSVQLRPGMELLVHDCTFRDDLILEAEYNHLNLAFGIGFCLRGNAKGKMDGIEQEYNLNSGEGSLGFSLRHKGWMQYQQGEQIKAVTLVMEPMIFNDFIDSQVIQLPEQLQQIINGKYQNTFYLHNFTMTSAMKMAAQQIINCPYQGLTRRLYLEGKGLEIISHYTDYLAKQIIPSPPSIYLRADDIERIHYAQELLVKNFQNPPSLANLAKLVGLNEYKLKIGFRRYFDNTVFGYLHDYRLEEAKKLLETNKFNINQVAHSVGYASETSFSSAFRKKFGVSPRVYRTCKNPS